LREIAEVQLTGNLVAGDVDDDAAAAKSARACE
jgi:hypothetical protein